METEDDNNGNAGLVIVLMMAGAIIGMIIYLMSVL